MNKKSINIILLTLNFVSILFILQIELNIFPLFSSEFEIETTTKINNIVSSISHGMIISSIFYLVVIYIPEYSKSITIRKLLTPRLSTIVYMMQQSIEYLSYKYKLPSQNVSLKDHDFNDFESMIKLENKQMDFNYRIMTNGTWTNYGTGIQNEFDHFIHEKEVVTNKIDEILTLPIIQHEEDELLECLANLRDAWFYTGVESFIKHGNPTVINFNKGVYDYYKYYKILKKYIKPFPFEINNKV